MSTLDQIQEAIDAHITELQREIAALEAAGAALRGESPSVARSVASKRSTSTRRRRRSTKPVSSNGNAVAAATASGDGAVVDAPVLKPRNRAPAKPSGSRKSVEVLLAGKLEAMLRESKGGLSAITISKRSNAGYTQVLALLRELEGTGQVRRSGTRRTSLWRVVTDEERIAERAAELEALSAGNS